MTGLALVLMVAAALTGRPATTISTDMTVCSRDAWGCADVSGAIIHQRGDLVAYLVAIANRRPVPPYLGAWALFVLCHEAAHLRGTVSERAADRWGIALAPTAAYGLGASPAWTRRMKVWLGWWATGIMPKKVPQ